MMAVWRILTISKYGMSFDCTKSYLRNWRYYMRMRLLRLVDLVFWMKMSHPRQAEGSGCIALWEKEHAMLVYNTEGHIFCRLKINGFDLKNKTIGLDTI
jgi:hypothetical protein